MPRVSEQLVDDGAALSELCHPAKTANRVQMNLYGVSGNEDCPICLEDALNCMACNLTYSEHEVLVPQEKVQPVALVPCGHTLCQTCARAQQAR